MKEALISVIVPVYKVEAYLERCVSSILKQTYKNLEIILVDDGSPDSCGKMCDDYAKKDKRVKVIHKENGGLSSARNAGIDIAKGEYISFIDSDDWINENFIERLYKDVVKNNADISCCGFLPLKENTNEKEIWYSSYKNEVLEGKEKFDYYYKNYRKNNVVLVVAWNKLYKREIFSELRYPLGRIYEDGAVVILLLSEAKRISLTNDELYYYTVRESSITGQKIKPSNVHSAIQNLEDKIEFYTKLGQKKYMVKEILVSINGLLNLYKKTDDVELKHEIKDYFLKMFKKYKWSFSLFYRPTIRAILNYRFLKKAKV